MNQTDQKPLCQKKNWATPKLTVYGDVEVLTQEYSDGDVADAVIQIGQPITLSKAPIG